MSATGIDAQLLRQLANIAVDSNSGVAVGPTAGEQGVPRLAGTSLDRGAQQQLCSVGHRCDAVGNLLAALGSDRDVAPGTIRLPDAGPQYPHVVIDFRHGSHGGARTLGGGLLLDRNGGAQAVDVVDLRLLQLPQELPGIGGKRLDVAPLAFRIDGVDGQAGFSASGDARTHGHRAARDPHGYVLEIVLASAHNLDCIVRPANGFFSFAFELLLRSARRLSSRRQNVTKHAAGVRFPALGNGLGRSGHDHPTAAVSALRTQIDDPVRRLNDIEVVFDADDAIPCIHETVQYRQQSPNVVKVKPGGGLVQQVQRSTGRALDQFACQLDSLGFAAGQRRAGLAQFEVVQADVVKRRQHRANLRNGVEVLQGFLHVHVQHVRDALALVKDLDRLVIEASPLAQGTLHPHVRQKVHLDPI